MRTFLLVLCSASALFYFTACHSDEKKQEQTEACAPVKDPNHPKPMALMMRAMADHCDSIRVKLLHGETVDSLQYPLMPFWSAEPTDSSELSPLFFSNAELFANAYRTLMQSKTEQKDHYTAVINACIHCHNSFCQGPLKRIRKLPLDFKP